MPPKLQWLCTTLETPSQPSSVVLHAIILFWRSYCTWDLWSSFPCIAACTTETAHQSNHCLNWLCTIIWPWSDSNDIICPMYRLFLSVNADRYQLCDSILWSNHWSLSNTLRTNELPAYKWSKVTDQDGPSRSLLILLKPLDVGSPTSHHSKKRNNTEFNMTRPMYEARS